MSTGGHDQLTGASVRIVVTFYDTPEAPPLPFLLRQLDAIAALMAVADVLSASEDPQGMNLMDIHAATMKDVATKLVVLRLVKASPMEVVLSVASAMTTFLFTARSLVWLLSKWEDLRAKRMANDYNQTAYEFMSSMLPANFDNASLSKVRIDDPDAQSDEERLETIQAQLRTAAFVLPTIQKSEIEQSDAP